MYNDIYVKHFLGKPFPLWSPYKHKLGSNLGLQLLFNVTNLTVSTCSESLKRHHHQQFAPIHDDVIKWIRFPRNWPYVRGIHRSPVNSPHKGQWRGALMPYFICAWWNDWINNRHVGDLRCHRAHHAVILMFSRLCHTRLICLLSIWSGALLTPQRCK